MRKFMETMKRIGLGSLALIGLLSAACGAGYAGARYAPPDPVLADRLTEALCRKINLSSVRVNVSIGQTPFGHGSGVIIGHKDGNTFLLTAAHVAMAGSTITLTAPDLNLNDYPAILVRGGDDTIGDFSTLVCFGLIGRPTIVADENTYAWFGRYTIVAGFPLAWPMVRINDGYSSGIRDGFLHYSAPSIYGNSGGGVFILVRGEPVLVGLCSKIGLARGSAVVQMGMAYPICLVRLNGGLKDIE